MIEGSFQKRRVCGQRAIDVFRKTRELVLYEVIESKSNCLIEYHIQMYI